VSLIQIANSFGYNVAGKRARREKEKLCYDDAGGRDGKAEITLKVLKCEEGHIALGKTSSQ
jgi:hypothetical protein